VRSLHLLIVIPLYLFGSITLLLSFILAARLLRLRVSVDPLVTGASALAIGKVVRRLGPTYSAYSALNAPAPLRG